MGIGVQVVYLQGDPRKDREGDREGRKVTKSFMMRVLSLRASGLSHTGEPLRNCRTCLRIVPPEGREAGVFI